MVHFLEHFKAIPVMFYINLPWTYQRYETFARRAASGFKRYILFSNNNVYIHITETRSGWSIGSKICSITYGKTSQLCSKGKHLKYIAHYLETHGKQHFQTGIEQSNDYFSKYCR